MKNEFNSYLGLTQRNIKVYFKDGLALFLSMLTQIIILGLYLLFLKNIYVRGIYNSLEGLEQFITSKDVEAVINSWLMSGVIGTSVVTAALNSLSVVVSDKQSKIDFDYLSSPVRSGTVVMSYFSGAVLSTVLASSVLLIAGLVFLRLTGTFCYTALDILKLFALVILGAVSSSIILLLIVSFIKKSSTLGSFGIMLSTVIGFVVGAYIPVSEFSEGTQTAVNIVPGAQIAGMIRMVLMKPAINNINNLLGGVDNGEFSRRVSETFAVGLKAFGHELSLSFMLTYSIAVIALFIIINIAVFKISSKRI